MTTEGKIDGIAPAPANADLRSEIKAALNRHSAENGSNTPDHVLADFLLGCLAAYDAAVITREKWHGRPAAGWPWPAADITEASARETQ